MAETTNNKVYWVKGNTQPFIIPLEQEVMTEQDEIVAEPYYPDESADIVVNFVGKWMKYPYIPRVDGNLLIFTVNATMPAGNYDVEIVVKNQDGTQHRSQWNNQVVITNSNPSVLQEWDEFKQQDITARAALFFFAKGKTGAGIAQGGSTGQVLVKKSNTDYDTEWQDVPISGVSSVNGKSGAVTLGSEDVGALPDTTKYGSTINLTMDGATYVITLSLIDQDGTVLNTKTVDLPIESVVVNGRYDSVNKKIVLTLQSGSTIDVPVGDLVAGLQTEITSLNMLDADLVDDTNSTHKFVTAQEKTAWNNKSDFSGSYNDLTDKPTIPTVPNNVSAFNNDAGYITKTVNDLVNYYLKSDVYTKTEVANLIAAIQQFHYEIYASISAVTSPAGNVLYLIGPTGTGSDKYEEYVYDSTKQEPWVKIGDTSIDLSGYYTSQQTDAAITQALNTALADYTTTTNLTQLLAGKQDVINDLSDIRSGASAGATAYQKPAGGIPKTDLAQGVQDSLDLADTALQEDTLYEDANGHDYVEIGGMKWATKNIGANAVTDAGLYFQWGDTQGYTAEQVGTGEGKKAFTWADYKFSSDAQGSSMTKYNATDGLATLDLEDDAARANWGGTWRMPTTEEMQAFGAAVNAVWTDDYQGSGVAGLVCTDKTDNTKVVFFPAAGLFDDGDIDAVGTHGSYWSSSIGIIDKKSALYFHFLNGSTGWQSGSKRYYGFPVRPILDTTQLKKDLDNKQNTLVSGTNIKTINNESILGSGNINIDISGKEDKTAIEAPVNQTDAALPITTLVCEVGKYYRLDVAVDTLAVTLPAMTDLTTVRTVVLYLTAGATPAVTISSTAPTGGSAPDVYYQDGFEIEAGNTYEVNCLWNGLAWIVASVEIVTNNGE